LVIGSIGSAMIGVLYYGGKLVLKGEMTGGQLMSFMATTQNCQRSLSQLGVLLSQILKSTSSIDRIRIYIQSENLIPLRGGIYPSFFKGDITFQNVTFKYPTRENNVLDKFNLEIKTGSMIALCGKSGSGKST
jgi:ATP-binding cassette subfamily B protein